MTDDEISGEYTRHSAKIQLGDGVDRRGDVTTEIVRERPEARSDANMGQHHVTIPSGEEVLVVADDAAFAEFYFELQRKVDALREVLDLDDEP